MPRRPISIGTRHLYKEFKKSTKKGDNKEYRVDFPTYRKILQQFGENFVKHVIENREGVEILSNRGTLRIGKKKMSALPLVLPDGKVIRLPWLAKDWTLRKETGKKYPKYNDHSDGYRMKWNWMKKGSHLKHQSLISLDIIKRWDRYLAKRIFAGKQDYFDLKLGR